MAITQTDKELTALAQDRPLQTPELHQSSDFYGHAAMLKDYCALPPQYPLKAVIEHGVQLNGAIEYIWDVDEKSFLPVFLCANPEHAEFFTHKTGKPAVAMGPMLLYVLGGIPEQPVQSVDAKGRLLVIPTHSTHHIKANYDADAFVRSFKAYAKQFSEVSVLLYWKDVLEGHADIYRRYGFNVLTAGHMYDPAFLPRFAGILADHSHIVSNCVGTHTLFATLMLKPIWYIDQRLDYYGTYDITKAKKRYSLLPTPEERMLMGLFAQAQDTVSVEQYKYVAQLTGTSCFKSPEAIRDILLFAEKRFAPFYKDKQHHLDALKLLASA